MGEVFAGRYELADPIGRGGVGAVWRAWDHRRRRYVAAKLLQQSDAHTLLRFVREQALRIDHPHVLAPASWAADDDKVLFTMDLVAGGSLVHLIGDYGPLPPQFVCVLLDQLLSGLSAVHAEGVVHRDIKPANLLLEATGTGAPHLRVSDFGIAMRKGEPRLTETNYVVGTPGYFAPEQAMGAEPDFPADLFAAGLVALYLLEGAKPDSRALIEHFVEHGTPRAPTGVPGPLWGVLAGLLQPDPEARFRTATGARKALLSAAELLPEPGPDDELIEVFDQLGPLPTGFGPGGPAVRGRRARPLHSDTTAQGISASRPEPDPIGPPEPEPESEPESASVPDPAPGPEPEASLPLMSETGSFHLPPPAPMSTGAPLPPPPVPPMPSARPSTPLPEPPRHQPPTPQPPAPPVPEPRLLPPAPAAASITATAPDNPAARTTPTPHAPSPSPAPAPHPAHAVTTVVPPEQDHHSLYTARGREVPRRHREISGRRPGPPPKVVVPVLFLALLCFTVGIWALTRA
ncbi:serine/threonine protein kinase [Streptomyces sp. SID14478]|uniref:serine/threonine-protein kinase n=1 Tax=Streptomyces sp. SID14478 TaxID=2706073 RepID=UPI0013DCB2C0|nr:serine/threonine-protein kinase [Streptomyces sp. SID14478]NEB79714.1 serine/threonine protein kinase [Streptomyces sp. SID14478]